MNFEEVGWRLAEVGRRLNLEWRCQWPQRDTLPSEELDRAISAWCAVLAKNLDRMIEEPPEIVKPWLVVRLRYAATICLALAH